MSSTQPAARPASNPHSGDRRRWLLPVVFALLAAALWWWGHTREIQATAEVAVFAQELIAADPNVRDRAWSRLDDGFLARELTAKLRALIPPSDARERLSIQVRPGDASLQSVGSATHAVAILRGPREMLTLRIAHPGEPGGIRVVGFIDHSGADNVR